MLASPSVPPAAPIAALCPQSVERTLGLVEPYLEVLHREITDAARMVQETGLHIKSFYMGAAPPLPSLPIRWTGC